MFNLGKIIISEKATEKISLDFIYQKLEEYKILAEKFIESEQNKGFENYLIYKKDFFIEDRLVMYIETFIENNETFVLEGKEYLERELKNFAYIFTTRENNFLTVILNSYIEEGSKYERNTAKRILSKFQMLEENKKNFKEEW